MNRQITNALLGIVAGAESPASRDVARTVRGQAGVSGARGGARGGRLLLVDYDPGVTTAQGILAALRGLGIEARLIGM
jgi:hypothetical protein